MYSIREILNREPVAVKAAGVAVAAAVLGTWPDLSISSDVILLWGSAAEIVLALFYVRAKSTPTVSAQEQTEQALNVQRAEITSFIATADSERRHPNRPLRAEDEG